MLEAVSEQSKHSNMHHLRSYQRYPQISLLTRGAEGNEMKMYLSDLNNRLSHLGLFTATSPLDICLIPQGTSQHFNRRLHILHFYLLSPALCCDDT